MDSGNSTSLLDEKDFLEQLLLTLQQELTGTLIGNRFCDHSTLELGRVQLVIVSDPKREYKRGHI